MGYSPRRAASALNDAVLSFNVAKRPFFHLGDCDCFASEEGKRANLVAPQLTRHGEGILWVEYEAGYLLGD
jgi:hypothetical protein